MANELSTEKLYEIFNSSILVIDHSTVTRSVIGGSLKEYGFKNIIKASSCEQAIEFLNERKTVFDLLTSDFDESDMPFPLFLSKLRAINKLDGMAFLIISDKIDLESASKLLSLNVENFLKKPFTSEDVCKVTLETLKQHLFPDDYSKNCRMALKLIEEKNLDQALVVLEEAIKQSKMPTNAVYLKGHIHILKGDIKKAKELFLEALKIKDNHLKSLIGLSFCAKYMKDDVLMYEISKKILKIDQYHIPSIKGSITGSIINKDYEVLIKQIKRVRFSFVDNENIKQYIIANAQNILINIINSEPEESVLKMLFALFKECLVNDFDKYISILELFSNYNYTKLLISEITELKESGKAVDEFVIFKIDMNILFNDSSYDSVILECKRYLNRKKPNHYVYEMLIDSYLSKNEKESAMDTYKEAMRLLSKAETIAIKDRFEGVLAS